MKPKPLLVYFTRHAPLPEIAALLTGYEVIRVRKRCQQQAQMVEAIAQACPRPPLVIMWVMPWAWVAEFIICVRKRWTNPGVEIVHANTRADVFDGTFTIQKLRPGNRVISYPWYPVGPVATERQKMIAAQVEAAKLAKLSFSPRENV